MARRCISAISARRCGDRRTASWPAWQNGKPGVLLLAFKQPGANVIETVERIKAALPALEASIPPVRACQYHRRSYADDPRIGE